jgi:hypothetical protein
MKSVKFSALIFLLLIAIQSIQSQERDELPVFPKTIFRLHLIVPGILVEQQLKSNSTLIFDFGSGFTYYRSEVNGVSESELYFNPYIRIETRKYFNLDQRNFFGKRIDYYSGQYFGFQVKIGIPTVELDAWQSFGPIWGFQRTLGKKGYWNIGLGLGALNYGGDLSIRPIGDFGIGFILN